MTGGSEVRIGLFLGNFLRGPQIPDLSRRLMVPWFKCCGILARSWAVVCFGCIRAPSHCTAAAVPALPAMVTGSWDDDSSGLEFLALYLCQLVSVNPL